MSHKTNIDIILSFYQTYNFYIIIFVFIIKMAAKLFKEIRYLSSKDNYQTKQCNVYTISLKKIQSLLFHIENFVYQMDI